MYKIAMQAHEDGFTTANINCFDLAIATAVGCYSQEYYDFYCLHYCLMSNYYSNQKKNQRDIVLEKLGLCKKAIEIQNEENALVIIKETLSNNNPVIIVPELNTLFYLDYYGDEELKHRSAFLVTEYYEYCFLNKTKKQFVIRHHLLNQDYTKTITGATYYRLKLPEECLREIISENIEQNDDIHQAFIFSIERIGIIRNINLFESLQQTTCWFDSNNFLEYIQAIYLNPQNTAYYIEEFMHDKAKYVNSFTMFFSILEKYLRKLDNIKTNIMQQLLILKSKFLNIRELVYAQLMKEMIKNGKISEFNLQSWIKEINEADKELTEFINLLTLFYQNDPKTFQVIKNIAKEAKLNADSETLVGSDRYNIERIVNGMVHNETQNMWYSNTINEKHWVEFQFESPRSIQEIKIYHYHVHGYITQNFSVIGSNNNFKTSKVLYNISGNQDTVTNIKLKCDPYQQIRIDITKPANFDNTARIFEVEIYE